MSGSYGHLVTIGVTQEEIVDALGNEPAYVAMFGATAAVFSRAAVADTEHAALDLSRLVAGDVIGFFVFDDDILACVLCRAGEAVAEVTVPALEEYAGIDADELELMAEWLDEDVPGAGNVNDATGFVMGVGTGDLRQALHILGDEYADGDRVFATQRHRDLLAALELPVAIAGWDFYQCEADTDGFRGPTPTPINPIFVNLTDE